MRGLQLVRRGGTWHFLAGCNRCIQGINWQGLLGGDCNSLPHSTDVCRRKMANRSVSGRSSTEDRSSFII